MAKRASEIDDHSGKLHFPCLCVMLYHVLTNCRYVHLNPPEDFYNELLPSTLVFGSILFVGSELLYR